MYFFAQKIASLLDNPQVIAMEIASRVFCYFVNLIVKSERNHIIVLLLYRSNTQYHKRCVIRWLICFVLLCRGSGRRGKKANKNKASIVIINKHKRGGLFFRLLLLCNFCKGFQAMFAQQCRCM